MLVPGSFEMAPIAVDSDPDTVVKTSAWIGRTCRRLIGGGDASRGHTQLAKELTW